MGAECRGRKVRGVGEGGGGRARGADMGVHWTVRQEEVEGWEEEEHGVAKKDGIDASAPGGQ